MTWTTNFNTSISVRTRSQECLQQLQVPPAAQQVNLEPLALRPAKEVAAAEGYLPFHFRLTDSATMSEPPSRLIRDPMKDLKSPLAPKPFKGDKLDDALVWLAQFNQFASTKEWDKDTCKVILPCYLQKMRRIGICVSQRARKKHWSRPRLVFDNGRPICQINIG